MEYSFYVKDMEDCITVVDVYDSAALIGKDFEYLIEQYGVEAVTDLMPKVIRVLEQLEYLAAQSEKENENIVQLEATIRRLNSDKEERNRERQRYEQVRGWLELRYGFVHKSQTVRLRLRLCLLIGGYLFCHIHRDVFLITRFCRNL